MDVNSGTAQSLYETLLGVTIDTNLSFKTYPTDMWKSECKVKGFG